MTLCFWTLCWSESNICTDWLMIVFQSTALLKTCQRTGYFYSVSCYSCYVDRPPYKRLSNKSFAFIEFSRAVVKRVLTNEIFKLTFFPSLMIPCHSISIFMSAYLHLAARFSAEVPGRWNSRLAPTLVLKHFFKTGCFATSKNRGGGGGGGTSSAQRNLRNWTEPQCTYTYLFFLQIL